MTASGTTSQQVNEAQMAALLGVPTIVVVGTATDPTRTVRAEVSQATLDGVLASYVYAATDQDRAAELRAKADAALAANLTAITQAQTISTQAAAIENTTGGRTTAQNTADIRALAQGVRLLAEQQVGDRRELNALIRLVIGRLEDTTGT